MNISYEDFFKLSYSLIDLNDEEYLKDEERLRYIISKIKVKNPKKYLKEENSFKLTKEIFEECKEDLIFLKYILNKLNVNNKAKNIIENYLDCIGNIEFYLRDFELPFEKIQEIHLKYLDSFKDKTNFNIIKNFLKNNPDFLSFSSVDDEISFADNTGGLTYTCFNRNFVSLNEDYNNDHMLSIYIHEMQHITDLEKKELGFNNLYYELKSILMELYLSDYVKENYDEEYGLNVKLHILFNKLHLLYEAVVLSDILNKLIDKNKKINILSYQETTKTYNEEEILDIISSNEDVDGFVHCYDSLIALNIYFNNKNCDDGLKIADNYVKNSSIQEINMDINFDEVLTNLINELMSVVKSLEKYINRKIVRIK